LDFDAGTVRTRFRPPNFDREEFYECHLG
jgi:hypothetical protein